MDEIFINLQLSFYMDLTEAKDSLLLIFAPELSFNLSRLKGKSLKMLKSIVVWLFSLIYLTEADQVMFGFELATVASSSLSVATSTTDR